MSDRQRAARPRAFILTGFLPVVCRDSIYIDDLGEAGPEGPGNHAGHLAFVCGRAW